MELHENTISFCFSFIIWQFNNIFTFLYLQCLIILANNRILVFILQLFLFLSLLFKLYNNVFTCKYAQIL